MNRNITAENKTQSISKLNLKSLISKVSLTPSYAIRPYVMLRYVMSECHSGAFWVIAQRPVRLKVKLG